MKNLVNLAIATVLFSALLGILSIGELHAIDAALTGLGYLPPGLA